MSLVGRDGVSNRSVRLLRGAGRLVVESIEPRTLLAATPRGTMPTGYIPVNYEVGPILADASNRVFVIDKTHNSLHVFDTNLAAEIGTIPLIGTDPRALSIAPDGIALAVAFRESKSIQVIDARSLSTDHTFAIPYEPTSIAIGTGNKVYVSTAVQYDGTGGIVAFDLTTGAAGRSLPGYFDNDIQTDATGQRLYASSDLASQVREFDVHKPSLLSIANSRAFDMDVENYTGFVADRTANRVFGTGGGLYGIQRIDMNVNRYTNTLFDEASHNNGVASAEGNADFFVRSDDEIYQMSKDKGVKRYRYVTRDYPVSYHAMAATPNGRLMYVSSIDNGYGLGIIGAASLRLESGTATISGSVFLDIDLDGIHDAGETEIPSLSAYLDLDHDGMLDLKRNGDAIDEPYQYVDGTYGLDGSFQVLPPGPGKYTLRFEAPQFGSYNDAIVTTPASMEFTVQAGQQITGLDLGVTYEGSVELNFYQDANGDGARNVGEADGGTPDIYLDLNGNAKHDDGEPVQRWSSDPDFDIYDPDLYRDGPPYFYARPGSYDVRTLDSSRAATTRPATRVTIVANQSSFAAIGVGTAHHFSGKLFHDLDADGTRDTNETGYGGVAVWLDLDGDGRRESNEPAAKTKLNGAYDILSIGAVNNAPIRYANAFGRLISTAHRKRVTLAGSVTSVRADAGVYLPPMIVVDAFIDADRDGNRDTSEAARAGVPVFLDLDFDNKQDKNEPSAITDSAGRAVFANLSPGQYLLRSRLSAAQTTTTPSAALLTVKIDTAATMLIGLR